MALIPATPQPIGTSASGLRDLKPTPVAPDYPGVMIIGAVIDKSLSFNRDDRHESARAMRGQSDKVVGIIVSRLDSPSENQAVRTMLPLLYQQGFDPIVMESQFETRLVQEHLHVLRQRNVDGVILFGRALHDDTQPLLARRGVPHLRCWAAAPGQRRPKRSRRAPGASSSFS